jgi:hypothetical protein
LVSGTGRSWPTEKACKAEKVPGRSQRRRAESTIVGNFVITRITHVSGSATSLSFPDESKPASLRCLSPLVEYSPREEAGRTELNRHHIPHFGTLSETLIERHVMGGVHCKAVIAFREVIEPILPVLSVEGTSFAGCTNGMHTHIC